MSFLNTTALFESHQKLNAKMVEFHGWQMPLHYGSAIAEHMTVRESVGMFDVSHMTIIDMIGAGGRHFLRRLMTRDVDEIKHPGGACYTCMCNEQGGIIDDVLIYYRNPDSYRLVFNAATRQRVLQWLNDHTSGYAIGLQIRDDLSMIAVQGPKAIESILNCCSPYQMDMLSTLKRFNSVEDQSYFFSRTGYTGEDGLEIMIPAAQACELWQKLIDAGVKPCGLAARDSLRLEAGLMLNGQDMSEHTTPLECAIDWTISWTSSDREFIGKPSLMLQKQEDQYPRIIGLKLNAQAILRTGQQVFADGHAVGQITSGIYSPWLKSSLAFARIDHQALNQPLSVEIRGQRYSVEQHSTRFYSPTKK